MKSKPITIALCSCALLAGAAGHALGADTLAPKVTAFTVPSAVKTTTIPLTAFTASDNIAVTGYLVTLTPTIPLAVSSGWNSAPPASVTVSSPGQKTLYAWAKDAAGNISLSKSATTIVDTAIPAVFTFTLPAVSSSLTVPVTSFTAGDNVGVNGYLISESSAPPLPTASGWNSTRPTGFTLSSGGQRTLYAWARDTVGNVSLPRTAAVTVDTTAPVVTSFTVPGAVKTTIVPVSAFTASDNIAVAGYMITLSPVRPQATASGWSATRPASFNAGTSGVKNLYAWVKDTAGNVSIPVMDSVTVDATAPVVTSFSVPASSNSLTIPVTAFGTSDNIGVTAWMISESAAIPSLLSGSWKSAVPTSYTAAAAGSKTLYAWARDEAGNISLSKSATCTVDLSQSSAAFTMEQTLSDQAQGTTLAFSALAMMTGNLGAQSFFPPGKVADYTGFQYLRDNDPDSMGHNTSFLTRVAENVIYILNDTQMARLAALSKTQNADFTLYGAKRFPLMKAFRRLMENDIPSGTTGLSLEAVTTASRELYVIDGQVSYDRAVLYAEILNSLSADQKAYLAAMKGKGWKSWPDTSVDPLKTTVEARKTALGRDVDMVAVMTYASDLFSWYAGSIDADVYFCPERQGTYFGSFFIKDAPAIGHEGYSINEQLTATAGRALSDATYGYVDTTQATLMSSLVDTQRNNLYANTATLSSGVQNNIVAIRTKIATLLRTLLTTADTDGSVKAQVLALSGTYGELDGVNNYNYATVMASVYKTLSTAQKTKLMDLRASIMKGTYADGTSFDFTYTATPYLYSAQISDATASGYVGDTDGFFK